MTSILAKGPSLRMMLAALLAVVLAFSGSAWLYPQKAEAAYSASKANAIVTLGKKFTGTRYVFGASTSTTRAFDCSSFTKYVYARHGISLPRTSVQQASKGKFVPRSQLKKGDLVFFSTSNSKGKIAHVSIYAGNGKLLHAIPNSGVTTSNLNSSFWSKHYKTARRVIN